MNLLFIYPGQRYFLKMHVYDVRCHLLCFVRSFARLVSFVGVNKLEVCSLLLPTLMLILSRVNLLAFHHTLNRLCTRFEHGFAVELLYGLHVIKQQIGLLLFGVFLFHSFHL